MGAGEDRVKEQPESVNVQSGDFRREWWVAYLRVCIDDSTIHMLSLERLITTMGSIYFAAFQPKMRKTQHIHERKKFEFRITSVIDQIQRLAQMPAITQFQYSKPRQTSGVDTDDGILTYVLLCHWPLQCSLACRTVISTCVGE